VGNDDDVVVVVVDVVDEVDDLNALLFYDVRLS
jgi:hypothetical protein